MLPSACMSIINRSASDTYYIPVAPHNVASPIGTVAAAHVCAAMNNFLVMEYHAHGVLRSEQAVENAFENCIAHYFGEKGGGSGNLPAQCQ